jgi:hypothetical protein
MPNGLRAPTRRAVSISDIAIAYRAGDRTRTGDVQLGKLRTPARTSAHQRNSTSYPPCPAGLRWLALDRLSLGLSLAAACLARSAATASVTAAGLMPAKITPAVILATSTGLNVTSPRPSSGANVERRVDMLVSTLRRYVEAMGGRLAIVAAFPDGEVRVSNLGELAGADESSYRLPVRLLNERCLRRWNDGSISQVLTSPRLRMARYSNRRASNGPTFAARLAGK